MTKALVQFTRGLVLLAFWSIVAFAAIGFTVYKTTGLGGEIPGFLQEKTASFVTETAAAVEMSLAKEFSVTPVSVAPIVEVSDPKKHVVRKGEWLSKIADHHGIAFRSLVEANRTTYPSLTKNPNLIHPGWILVIPTETPSPEKSVAKKQNASPEKTVKVAREKHRKSLASKKTARNGKPGRKIRKPADMIDVYHDVIGVLAPQSGVDTALAYAIPWQESGGKACARGDNGASVGLWQFKARTIQKVGYNPSDRCDPAIATRAGLKHLRDNYQSLKQTARIYWPQLFNRPDWRRILSDAAIAAHNGPYWAEQAIRGHHDPARWEKTREYVSVIRAHQKIFKQVLANNRQT